MESAFNFSQLISAVIYTVFGSVAFAITCTILNWVTPNDFWHEILEEHNNALAIVIGAIAIGLSIIISSAIKG